VVAKENVNRLCSFTAGAHGSFPVVSSDLPSRSSMAATLLPPQSPSFCSSECDVPGRSRRVVCFDIDTDTMRVTMMCATLSPDAVLVYMISRTGRGRVLYALAAIQPTRLLGGVHVFHGFSIVFLIAALPVCDTKAPSLSSMCTFAARAMMAGYMKESVRGWHLECVRYTCAPLRKEVPMSHSLCLWCLCVPDDSTAPNNMALS